MDKIIKQVTSTTNTATSYAIDTTDKVSEEMKRAIEAHLNPVRQTVLKRYPVLFSLFGVFGVATTYYGFEKILSQYELLNRYPLLILLLGISTLVFTGTIYKKLN